LPEFFNCLSASANDDQVIDINFDDQPISSPASCVHAVLEQLLWKPSEESVVLSLAFQAVGTYCKPYNALRKRSTFSSP
jgi:hypothetical protein